MQKNAQQLHDHLFLHHVFCLPTAAQYASFDHRQLSAKNNIIQINTHVDAFVFINDEFGS